MKLPDLREQRAAKVAEMRGIVESAEREGRDLGDGERARFDTLKGELATLEQRIVRAETLAELERLADAEPAGGAEMARELRNYSLARALTGALAGRLDGLEAACHQELSRGREVRGVMVPTKILLGGETRAQEVATDPKGGYLVPTVIQSVADRFRPALMVEAMGCLVLRDLVGDIELPALASSGTAQWIEPESSAVTTTDAAFEKVALFPRTVAGQYELSRRLLINATAAEPLLRRDLGQILATAIDAAAINGSFRPLGILNTSNVTKATTETMGSPAVTDFAATAANLIYDLDAADVPRTSRGFLTSPKVAQACRKSKDADSHTIPLAELFHNERVEVSSNVPDTIGSGANKSALLYGEWPELVLAYWSGVDLLANPYHSSVASRGALLLHAFVDVDVAVRRAAAFAFAEI
jgi:HK97 family phage major capsid protein